MENTGFKVSSVFFILYIYRMKKIMKEKNQVVPDEVLSKEFLSQFKTEADVTGNNTGNSRNGSYPKKIQTEHGESVISIPCDRNGQFEPIAVPKHESHGLSIEGHLLNIISSN